jgi:hypothetical protein
VSFHPKPKEEKMKKLTLAIALVASVLTAILVDGTTELQAGHYLNVTITNVTRGQVITPPVLISHDRDFQLFTVGDPASSELVALAEDGNTAPLEGLIGSHAGVHDYTVSTVGLGPGESVSLQVDTRGNFRYISALGMLATTNDAFFAIQGVRVPANVVSADPFERTLFGYAYDAGSEANSELCDYIPGPPCENPFMRDTGDAEGYVFIHSGIHGTGDLDPADYDWRNPVAIITIDRMPGGGRETDAQ